jgi:hypothetical protein
MNSTTAGQAPNKQTFVTAHYFKPHDKRPSFSSVMSGFLTRWMKEPELYTPWSTRRTCASKGSHPRCLSVNVPLNSSNLRSFSLVLSPVTPQSIEGTHTSHVRSVSTPSSGSSPSGEATRLKLVTCARTPNEQRVTVAETISSTASTTPSSEIPGDWEEHVERLDTHLGEDEEQVRTIPKPKSSCQTPASIIQPSGSLAAKSTITQPVNAEWANIYSNEEVSLVAFYSLLFSGSYFTYVEWSRIRPL